ncbi:MAG: MarR family winged helix-turn-helix transcriptional regulator [Methylocella sp.]
MTGRLEQRLSAAVKQLQLGLRVAIDRALADCDLGMAQAAVLDVLAERGDQTCSEAARSCAITRQSIQEIVTGLYRRGLLEKSADPADARHIVIDLTEEGRQAARKCRKTIQDIETRMVHGLRKQDQAKLLSRLNACTRNLDQQK